MKKYTFSLLSALLMHAENISHSAQRLMDTGAQTKNDHKTATTITYSLS